MKTKEVIRVERGVAIKLAKLYGVPKYQVSRALNYITLGGISKAIRATALESYGGKVVVITEEEKPKEVKHLK